MEVTPKIVLLGLSVSAGPALAANVIVEAIPMGWRLENYAGDSVVAYFTGSSCATGQLTFGSSATLNDKNRFWALVMTAKVSGKRIGVVYDNATSTCDIVSFYFKEE
jgi:hypothetical protein